jgi:hypothetical protein
MWGAADQENCCLVVQLPAGLVFLCLESQMNSLRRHSTKRTHWDDAAPQQKVPRNCESQKTAGTPSKEGMTMDEEVRIGLQPEH